ncbi:MAG TPA: hypothetical protein VFF52_16380 [Isosphaeraceae bacterium]|nr:hypothetical protein [Isosphaeraceae bacterium]
MQDDLMATAETSTNQAEDKEKLREEWLERLSDLVETVRGWAQDLDWSTRRIEKKMEDSELGTYKAPALLLQKETVRALLEPIAHSAPGVAGIVDFYLMPAFDDIARLFFSDDGWQLYHEFPGAPTAADLRKAEPRPLSKETFQSVLEAMTRNAESSP